MAWVLGLVFDWIYIALRPDSVWRRQSKRSTRQHGVQSQLRSRTEAVSNMIPARSLPYPLPIRMCVFPMVCRILLGKVLSFGLFIEIYTGFIGITPAFFLPLFCRNLTRMYAASMPWLPI